MTTQHILLSALIFSTMNNIASEKSNSTNNNSSEKITFKKNFNKLNYHAANFVSHFEDWSKEEQDKITIYNSPSYRGYVLSGKPEESDLFDNNVTRYLERHVSKKELIPFLEAMEYLKKQK